MRAVVLTAINQLSVANVPTPEPREGEVRVKLHAAALNHRDVWIKQGQYAGLKYPTIPGSDGAGEIEAVGPGVEAAWLGRAVLINPSLEWGAGETAQGPGFEILGLPRDGTFAEYVVVPAGALSARPAHLDWAQAAALPLAGLTAYRALVSRAKVTRGERVLITGVGGGVAMMALSMALTLGAEVWVTSGSPAKLAQAQILGARGGFVYTDGDWVKQARAAAGGFDVIVDGAGGAGFGGLLDVAAPGARVVVYGATRGAVPAFELRKIFWKQISLLGSTMGSPRDWSGLLQFVGETRFVPAISQVFPLERAAEAFQLMERGEQRGKIVLTPEGARP